MFLTAWPWTAALCSAARWICRKNQKGKRVERQATAAFLAARVLGSRAYMKACNIWHVHSACMIMRKHKVLVLGCPMPRWAILLSVFQRRHMSRVSSKSNGERTSSAPWLNDHLEGIALLAF
eukprot:596231-Pelagomonas_calceolata.AAC.3